jgi:hypothetical protein
VQLKGCAVNWFGGFIGTNNNNGGGDNGWSVEKEDV